MTTSSGISNRFVLAALLLAAFAAGAGAQHVASVSMRGKVMDANTVAESVEYWEIRGASGESIVITGRNDLPIIRWLKQSKNRSVAISLEATPEAALTVPR